MTDALPDAEKEHMSHKEIGESMGLSGNIIVVPKDELPLPDADPLIRLREQLKYRIVPTEHLSSLVADLDALMTRLKDENVRLQRARIGDAEIIGRWQCQAEAADARLASLPKLLKQWARRMARIHREADKQTDAERRIYCEGQSQSLSRACDELESTLGIAAPVPDDEEKEFQSLRLQLAALQEGNREAIASAHHHAKRADLLEAQLAGRITERDNAVTGYQALWTALQQLPRLGVTIIQGEVVLEDPHPGGEYVKWSDLEALASRRDPPQ